MKVTNDTIFGELLEEYPQTETVLKKYLGEAYCLSCPGKMFDTIGNGTAIHGLSDVEASAMLHDLQIVVDRYESGELKREDYVLQGDNLTGNGSTLGYFGGGNSDSGDSDDDIIGSPWWVDWGDDHKDK